MFSQEIVNDVTECINYISSAGTDNYMSYYRETPSTFLNFDTYMSMWRIILLNDILGTIQGHTNLDIHWIPPDVRENLDLTVQGIVAQIDASPNCYHVHKELIVVEDIKHL